MKPNKLRKLLQAGQPSLGTRLHSIWPATVEALGHTGLFDYVEFLAEYAPFDLFALDNFCRAVELFDMSAVIKVEAEPRTYLAQRGVGAGFQGVLFADVRSAQDARDCVRILKPDTPQDGGLFSVSMRRFTYMGYGGTPEYAQAVRDIVVMVMIVMMLTVSTRVGSIQFALQVALESLPHGSQSAGDRLKVKLLKKGYCPTPHPAGQHDVGLMVMD